MFVVYVMMFMGKGLFDEQQSGFVGIYSGIVSVLQIWEVIENVDIIICIGMCFIDIIIVGFI